MVACSCYLRKGGKLKGHTADFTKSKTLSPKITEAKRSEGSGM
jgi:hypothetical protein